MRYDHGYPVDESRRCESRSASTGRPCGNAALQVDGVDVTEAKCAVHGGQAAAANKRHLETLAAAERAAKMRGEVTPMERLRDDAARAERLFGALVRMHKSLNEKRVQDKIAAANLPDAMLDGLREISSIPKPLLKKPGKWLALSLGSLGQFDDDGRPSRVKRR